MDQQSSRRAPSQIWLEVREKNRFFFKSAIYWLLTSVYGLHMVSSTIFSSKYGNWGPFFQEDICCTGCDPFFYVAQVAKFCCKKKPLGIRLFWYFLIQYVYWYYLHIWFISLNDNDKGMEVLKLHVHLHYQNLISTFLIKRATCILCHVHKQLQISASRMRNILTSNSFLTKWPCI